MAISPNQSATHNDDVAFENPRKPLPHNDCSNVALQKDGKSEEVIEGITVRENESGLMHYQISDEVEDERS